MKKYETVAGTPPDLDEQHELRTIVRRDEDDQMLYMLTEIADGTFVAWDQCARCNKRVNDCSCPSGPVEPGYIARWRTDRMTAGWADRGVEPALPTTITERDRTKRAVIRALLAEGYTVIAPERPEEVDLDTPSDTPTEGEDAGMIADDDTTEATQEAADDTEH